MAADHAVVGIRKDAACSRTYTERVEVAARHQFDGDSLEAAAREPAVRVVFDASDRGDALEHVVVASKVAIELIREQIRRSVWRETGTASRERAAEEPQLLGVTNGQLAQHQRVDEAENGRVGADAERQRQDGDDREPWVAAKKARRVTNVADAVGEPRPDPRVS